MDKPQNNYQADQQQDQNDQVFTAMEENAGSFVCVCCVSCIYVLICMAWSIVGITGLGVYGSASSESISACGHLSDFILGTGVTNLSLNVIVICFYCCLGLRFGFEEVRRQAAARARPQQQRLPAGNRAAAAAQAQMAQPQPSAFDEFARQNPGSIAVCSAFIWIVCVGATVATIWAIVIQRSDEGSRCEAANSSIYKTALAASILNLMVYGFIAILFTALLFLVLFALCLNTNEEKVVPLPVWAVPMADAGRSGLCGCCGSQTNTRAPGNGATLADAHGGPTSVVVDAPPGSAGASPQLGLHRGL